jgi:hypothetical protein
MDFPLEVTEVLVFQCPETVEGLRNSPVSSHKCKFAVGPHNTRLVSRILLLNGVDATQDDEFTLLWATSPESDTISVSSPLQRINHFPFSKQLLGDKAELAQIIQTNEHLKDFPQFFPRSYVLPDDRDVLFRAMKANPRAPFIGKPPKGSCGHGIKIVMLDDFYTIPNRSVVSEYIARPLTIDGFKFDLRIYVLVTSFGPLRAFVYDEGLARFATEQYSIGKDCVFSQLTNATLNKKGRNWCNEFKWKLSDLLLELEHRMKRNHMDILLQIRRTVAQTLALVQPSMVPTKRTSPINPFFELYGFDLLLDRDFKMWLLEINTFPSMGYDEEVDFAVKGPLLANALSIIGIPNESAAELRSKRVFVEADQIASYDAELVRQEDLRNVQAGAGFTRIFPSDETADLNYLLATPPYIPLDPQKPREQKGLNPKKLGALLSSDQAMQLLIDFLQRLSADESQLPRLERFLRAQGCKISRHPRAVMNALAKFVRNAELNRRTQALPDAIRRILLTSGDEFLCQLFSHCHLPDIHDIATLLP